MDDAVAELTAIAKAKSAVDVSVERTTNGGLDCRFRGVRCFLPKSQVGLMPDGIGPESLLGMPIRVKVLSVDEKRCGCVVSRKAFLDEARETEAWATLQVGKSYNGVIKNLAGYGVFVDVQGAVGLLHRNEIRKVMPEIGDKDIDRAKDIFKKGQEIKVSILTLDASNKRIGLSWDLQTQ